MTASAPIDTSHEVEAKFFRGLGDPTRLRILSLLLAHGELPLARLIETLGEPRSRVSMHLSCLRACGYVSARRDGRFLYHRIRDQRVALLLRDAERLVREPATRLVNCAIIDGESPDMIELVADGGGEGSAGSERSEDADSGEFGQWLLGHMQRATLDVAAFAAAVGVSAAAVHRWLYRGGHPAPHLRARLAAALDVPVEELRRQVRTRPVPTASPFVRWLDAELERRDWTRAELADRMRLDRHAVTAWYRHGALPRRTTLQALAQTLAVPLSAIPVG